MPINLSNSNDIIVDSVTVRRGNQLINILDALDDAGVVGPQGPAGLIGPQGPAGPQGEIGPQGIQGIPGKDGKDADLKAIEQSVNQFKEVLQKDVTQYKAKVNTILSDRGGGGAGE